MGNSNTSGSSETAEVELTEKKETAIFCNIHHPCYFLQQLLRSLFRCLGLDYAFRANQASHNPKPQDPSDVVDHSSCGTARNVQEDPTVTAENSGSNDQIIYQDDDDVPASTAEQPVDPPSTTANQQIITSALTSRRSRRSGLSKGAGPQTN